MTHNVSIDPSFEESGEYDDEKYTEASVKLMDAIYMLVAAGASSKNIEDELETCLSEAVL